MLEELGIVQSNTGKAATVFVKCFPDALSCDYETPSGYVHKMWSRYEETADKNNNLNGKIFEYLVAVICIREKLLPLYLEAKVAFVPNVNYDAMLYCEEVGPICMSLKTSLRERFKQADLEAIALKYVHRRALCYLITLSEKEAFGVKQKIKNGDIIGLNKVVVATNPEFDTLIMQLKSYELIEPGSFKVIEASSFISKETLKKYLD